MYAADTLLIFLPPYSPDFMPCEGVFSEVKSWIRANDAAWRECDEPEHMVFEGFLNVSRTHVENFIHHAGYTWKHSTKLKQSIGWFFIKQTDSIVTVKGLEEVDLIPLFLSIL